MKTIEQVNAEIDQLNLLIENGPGNGLGILSQHGLEKARDALLWVIIDDPEQRPVSGGG